MSTVLEERKDLMIILREGKVEALPKTPYTILKHKYFQGRRIFYVFNDEMRVAETYDDGIFNVYLKSAQLQIRKKDRLAESIIQHYETGDASSFETLFREEYAEQNRLDLLKHLISEYRSRVNFEHGLFIVDELFAVDQHGNAYVKDELHEPTGWRSLCLVAQGQLMPRYVETPIGYVQLDERGLTILAKILFLLNPNLEDEVFTRQLPEKVIRIVEQGVSYRQEKEGIQLEV